MRIFSPKDLINKEKISRVKGKMNISWKKIGRACLYLGIAGFFIVAGVFAWFWKDLPSPGNLNNRYVVESTKIYDRTGEHLLYEVHGEEKRTQITFSDMPDNIKYATLALEDDNFYNHPGIEIKGILRAVFKDVINLGKAQGGSTITQQLIKKSVLTDEKTLTRKIKEAILSIELEQKFEKDEIFEMYLNIIPYGSNAYGIESAAQTFFGKHARELTLDEAALVASLPQAPTYYSPYGLHPEALKGRQEYALKRMADLGYITKEQAEEAKNVDVFAKLDPNKENISAPHFVMYVKEYLVSKYGEQAVAEGGMKVYTTLDWAKQLAAEKAVREGVEKNAAKYKASNAALVAMDPKNGQVLAMVGSKDYFDKSIDGQVNVAIRQRQPGSSFKPFVYLTAFQKGYTPETNLWDVDINFSTDDGKTYNPKNYDGKNRGLLEMRDALAMSLNVPAVETLYLAGVQNSINTAHQLGITTLKDPDKYGLSLVLGGGEVTLLDHTNAYATLATGGIHHDKVSILRVEDNKGNILEQAKSGQGERVVEEKHIAMLDYVMSTNELRAPVFGNNNPLKFDGRQVAAKTGTTNEWRDAWTMGFTPSLAVGVWAGNNNNSPMANGADGIYTAAPIWRAFMDEALKNMPIEEFPKYEKEETGKDILDGKLEMKKEVEVCQIPGSDDYCLASGACPDKLHEDKKFADAHSILYYLDKDDPRGDQPEHPDQDPQFKGWEKAVRNWLGDQKGMSSDPAPTEECKDDDFEDAIPSVEIISPGSGSTITSSSFSVSARAKAGYGIDRVTISVNGSEIASTSSSDASGTYTIPLEQKQSDLKITAKVRDRDDNESDTSITVRAQVP